MAGLRVMPMDRSYGAHFVVAGVDSDQAAIDAALTTEVADLSALDNGPPHPDLIPAYEVLETGWWRWGLCLCGDGHRRDLWPAQPDSRGAFLGRMVGERYW